MNYTTLYAIGDVVRWQVPPAINVNNNGPQYRYNAVMDVIINPIGTFYLLDSGDTVIEASITYKMVQA